MPLPEFNLEEKPKYKEIKEYVFKNIAISLKHRFSKKMFKNIMKGMKIDILDHASHSIAMRIYNFFAGKRQNKTIEFETPKTWWDHFKLKYRNKWWLRWLVKRSPPEMAEHVYNITRFVIFPKIDIPPDFDDSKHEWRVIR